MKLEDLVKGHRLSALILGPLAIVSVHTIDEDAVTVWCNSPDGAPTERILFRSDEDMLAIATVSRPWGFDVDGMKFKLAAEALRIKLAHLFDPMLAVHESSVESLPH